MSKKRILRVAAGVALAIVACIGAFVAYVLYLNRSAERQAHEFCDVIPIGSDISIAVTRAKGLKILWGSGDEYDFYFSGFIFDKAVCTVSVNREGKVTSKKAEMQYD